MTKKIFLSILASSLIIFGISMSCVLFTLNNYYSRITVSELRDEAEFLANGIERNGIDYLNGLVNKTKNRVTWISESGDVIFDSVMNSRNLENHADREEFTQAISSGVGVSERYSSTLTAKTVNYALRLADGTVIRISTTQSTIAKIIINMTQPIIVVTIIAVGLAVYFATIMTQKIVKPINDIDLDDPDIDEEYEEFSGLLHKLNKQNVLIEKQMRKLRQSQEQFNTITENMPEGVMVLNKKLEILSFNKSAELLFNDDDIKIGKSVLTLCRCEKFADTMHSVKDSKSGEYVFSINEKTYNMFISPVEIDKKFKGAVILILDITEKEEFERARREFTSNVSHELKTPLTSIYGISEMFMNGMIKDKDVHKFMKDIYDESGRLITMVNDIIKLSMLDENHKKTDNEKINLENIAGTVAERLKNAAELKNVSVEVVNMPDKDSPDVYGNSSIAEEMIYNLCDNAIKYNKDGGNVKMIIKTINGHTAISVQDTGIGIPERSLHRVFERFYCVDRSHSKAIGGTGLGLSIVKHAAAYHNAQILIDSEVGSGTTITVIF